VIVPVTSKLTASPLWESAIAWRSEPAPLSLMLVTVMVAACALSAIKHNAPKQDANRIRQVFKFICVFIGVIPFGLIFGL
jgi:hypothetical protein